MPELSFGGAARGLGGDGEERDDVNIRRGGEDSGSSAVAAVLARLHSDRDAECRCRELGARVSVGVPSASSPVE
jgi:hypothetical protein